MGKAYSNFIHTPPPCPHIIMFMFPTSSPHTTTMSPSHFYRSCFGSPSLCYLARSSFGFMPGPYPSEACQTIENLTSRYIVDIYIYDVYIYIYIFIVPFSSIVGGLWKQCIPSHIVGGLHWVELIPYSSWSLTLYNCSYQGTCIMSPDSLLVYVIEPGLCRHISWDTFGPNPQGAP